MIVTGLDFETANPRAGSICSVGAAVVEDGRLISKGSWLVRPHRTLDWFPESFQAIHGIAAADVRHKPQFPGIWPALRELLLMGDMVVAHHAAFDLRHLREVLALYGLPAISFPYACTCLASRRAFPELASHALPAVAAHVGHTFRHHDALEDARAAAVIAGRIGIPRGENVFASAMQVV